MSLLSYWVSKKFHFLNLSITFKSFFYIKLVSVTAQIFKDQRIVVPNHIDLRFVEDRVELEALQNFGDSRDIDELN